MATAVKGKLGDGRMSRIPSKRMGDEGVDGSLTIEARVKVQEGRMMGVAEGR